MGKRKQPAEEMPTEDRREPLAGEADAREVGESAADRAGDLSADDEAGRASTVEAVETPSPEAVLGALNDRYLRLAAEFDNFRKRTLRERTELRERAQADLARQLLETLDDLSRVTALEAEHASVHDVIEGIHMVERKLLRELEQAGFERVGVQGETFDPNYHEAVATHPASVEQEPGTIGNVLQPGYRLGSVLLRPARVVVLVDSDPDGE